MNKTNKLREEIVCIHLAHHRRHCSQFEQLYLPQRCIAHAAIDERKTYILYMNSARCGGLIIIAGGSAPWLLLHVHFHSREMHLQSLIVGERKMRHEVTQIYIKLAHREWVSHAHIFQNYTRAHTLLNRCFYFAESAWGAAISIKVNNLDWVGYHDLGCEKKWEIRWIIL